MFKNPKLGLYFYEIEAQMCSCYTPINVHLISKKRHCQISFPEGVLVMHISSSNVIVCLSPTPKGGRDGKQQER